MNGVPLLPVNDVPLLVVGAGGLLGRNVVAASPQAVPVSGVPWSSPQQAQEALRRVAGRMKRDGRPWQVAWCAGTGFVGASAASMEGEAAVLGAFLEALERATVPVQAVLLASSAGAVFAGSKDDPISEHSAPAPVAVYGREKLAQETIAQTWCDRTGIPVVVGRISNLYGPGQDLSKPQGLVSRLVRSSLTHQPITIFVPMDTLRDYLYVRDAGRLVVDALQRAARTRPAGSRFTVKILAAGRATTVAELVAELRRIRRKAPPIVFARTLLSVLQPVRLRFRSAVWQELDATPRTGIPAGIHSVIADQVGMIRTGALTPG